MIEEEKETAEPQDKTASGESSNGSSSTSTSSKGTSDHIVLKPTQKVLYDFLLSECDEAIPRRTYKMIWIDENVANDENQVYTKVFLDLGFKNF